MAIAGAVASKTTPSSANTSAVMHDAVFFNFLSRCQILTDTRGNTRVQKCKAAPWKCHLSRKGTSLLNVWRQNKCEDHIGTKYISKNHRSTSLFMVDAILCLTTIGKAWHWMNREDIFLKIAKFLAVGKAQKVIFWPTPDLKWEPLMALDSRDHQRGLKVLHPQSPSAGAQESEAVFP